jgi:hypothetical protein
VPEAGWAGKKNGELLSLAEQAGFQVFITLDRGVEYEQNLTGRRICGDFAASQDKPSGGFSSSLYQDSGSGGVH